MAINKVVYDGNTLIDLTGDSVTAAALYSGAKAHDKSGAQIVGTNPYNAANVDPAVTAALAAIAEKGVDTTGAGLADIAGLVAGIQAGGGKVATGTSTTAYDGSALGVQHDLGVKPNLFYVRSSSDFESNASGAYYQSMIFVCSDIEDINTYMGYALYASSASATTWTATGTKNNGNHLITDNFTTNMYVGSVTENKAYFNGSFGTTPYSRKFIAGRTYHWFVAKV